MAFFFIKLSSYFEEKIIDDHCSGRAVGVFRVTVSRIGGVDFVPGLVFLDKIL